MTDVKDNMDTMKNFNGDHDQLIKAIVEQLTQIVERVDQSVQTPPGNTNNGGDKVDQYADTVKPPEGGTSPRG